MKSKMNIKNITIIAILCLTSMFFINICYAANTGKVMTETARLRDKPQTDSNVLDLASSGDEVEILEEVDNWYKVKYKNVTGYIRKDLVETESTQTESTQTENTGTESEQIENTQENETEKNVNNSTNEVKTEDSVIEKGKYKVSEKTKLKIIPIINAIEIDDIAQNTEIDVTEILNDWVKVKTSDGKEGWIVKNKITKQETSNVENKVEENKEENSKTEETKVEDNKVEENKTEDNKKTSETKTMYVNSKTVNLRQKPDKTSQLIKQVAINTEVKVMSTENGWAYVDINGTTGYISESLLSDSKQATSRSMMTERSETSSSNVQKDESEQKSVSTTGSSVVSYAQKFLGSKYVYGGTTTSGFDCSGFTQFVYKNFGVSLSRTAAEQYKNGTAVTNLQAGDLVMFGKSGINHVGIYIGGNTFIHAANSSRGVTTDTLASGYYKINYVGARRIF